MQNDNVNVSMWNNGWRKVTIVPHPWRMKVGRKASLQGWMDEYIYGDGWEMRHWAWAQSQLWESSAALDCCLYSSRKVAKESFVEVRWTASVPFLVRGRGEVWGMRAKQGGGGGILNPTLQLSCNSQWAVPKKQVIIDTDSYTGALSL